MMKKKILILKFFQKFLRSIVAFPMGFFGYGLAMLAIGHWFLPLQVIGGGLATVACLVGSLLCGYKAKKLEELEKKKAEEQEKKKVEEQNETLEGVKETPTEKVESKETAVESDTENSNSKKK